MRIPLIAANWKMNTTVAEAVSLVKAIKPEIDQLAGVDRVLCPPFVSLSAVAELTRGTSIKLGAQNVYFESKGAYTGEISPIMLRDLCDFVIIGHSERRQYFSETDEIVNKKLKAAIAAGLTPIFCVGEALDVRESNKTEAYISAQVRNGLAGISANAGIVVAYEPIWAIGTGKAATGDQADTTCKLIRETIAGLWDAATADAVRILYGGSVTPDNITEFISRSDIDGGLVGGASLKANDFITIVNKAAHSHP
ncbi:MAG TPA: triose-phosphate isomerase [Dehalococcoidia bacterium]|nr:triose-phosphate isomerase [Dehalococcoidia bacterium]